MHWCRGISLIQNIEKINPAFWMGKRNSDLSSNQNGSISAPYPRSQVFSSLFERDLGNRFDNIKRTPGARRIASLMPNRVTFDCRKYDWQSSLEAHLKSGGEADLINFHFYLDRDYCIELARRFGGEFRLSRDPGDAQPQFRSTGR